MLNLNSIVSNPYVVAISILATIVSLILAIYFYMKSKEKKEISYKKHTIPIIIKKESKFDKLRIEYEGVQIEDLSVTKFTIWNSGNRTINSADMVTSKELTIYTNDENTILDADIIAVTEKTNRFILQRENERKVKVLFDYADKKDGFVLQVIHTGCEEAIKIEYKIKGGKPIRNITKEIEKKKKMKKKSKYHPIFRFSILYPFFSSILLAALFIISIILAFHEINRKYPFSTSSTATYLNPVSIMCSFASAVCFILMSIITIGEAKKTLSVPKELRYYSEFS